jgi:hypothetical protein
MPWCACLSSENRRRSPSWLACPALNERRHFQRWRLFYFLAILPHMKFEPDRYSWRERQAIAARRQRSFWWRNVDFIRSQPPAAQAVIVIGEVAIICLALILGFLVGVGLAALI